jgi:hypothetical protein
MQHLVRLTGTGNVNLLLSPLRTTMQCIALMQLGRNVAEQRPPFALHLTP